MNIPLISQVNADSDILEAWLKHHLRLGISSFHLVVHGPKDENKELYGLCKRYPVHIEDTYEGVFDSRDKRNRLNRILEMFRESWVVVADSDEFLELPYGHLRPTVRMLELAGADVLFAPMLQHISADGSLDTPETIRDPFAIQPLCSLHLYSLMGSSGDIRKFPLFLNRNGTTLFDGGNHTRPVGCTAESTEFRGVTHHFKFRSHVRERLERRMNSSHPYQGESAVVHSYLDGHNMRLPVVDAFEYSRREMFRRGLLVRPGVKAFARRLLGALRRPK